MDNSMPKQRTNKKRSRQRPSRKSSSRARESMAPVPRGLRTFKTTHKVSSTQANVSLIPNQGISIAGLTTGYVVGMYFTAVGVGFYQPSVGIGTAVTVNYSNAADYLPIFDIVRLLRVKVTAYFAANTSSNATLTTNMPLLYTAVDYDGTSNPTTPLGVLAYDNAKVLQANSTGMPCVNETIAPRLAIELNNAILTAPYVGPSLPGTWLDSTSYTAPHYGLFIAYDSEGASQNTTMGQLTIITELFVEWGANH